MVELDTFTVSLKKPPLMKATTALSLITQERNQKLELLIHLLANLPHSLVVCGPDGIGKTTLINILQERKNPSWLYCPVKGNAALSFEAIQDSLAHTLGIDKSQSLSAIFSKYGSQQRKIVLTIDDAGLLVPGLITTVVQYATANPALRIVFVLTHDELHVLSQSDRVLDDCHVIEIPPLSEKQCGEFLLELSSQPSFPLSQAAINEDLIEAVYRDTHGIPGKIFEQIPELSISQQNNNGGWWMAAAAVILVAITLGVQYLSPMLKDLAEAPSIPSPKPEESKAIEPKSSPALPTAQVEKEVATPIPQASLEAEPLVIESVSPAEPVVTLEIMPDNPKLESTVTVEKQPIITPVPVIEKPIPESKISTNLKPTPKAKNVPEISVTEEKKPIINPPDRTAGAYTLQLIVVSKQSSVDEIKAKYPSLNSGIRVNKFVAGGQERYALMYGSFDSAVAANKARQSLPAEFRNSLARKIGTP